MIRVVGADADGRVVLVHSLGHGEDPVDVLASQGWLPVRVTASGTPDALELRYAVSPTVASVASPRHEGPGLSPEQLARARRRRRVASYAVVVEDEAVLLTELSARTSAPGMWTLPGGGIDPGEEPVTAAVREVAEETGQVLSAAQLLMVASMRFLGETRDGPEDYHAVRLIHRGRCLDPSEPVVHDVGGSTSAARWVALAEVSTLPLVSTAQLALSAVGVLAG